jgi:UDP-glucuronate 4-epimerase
MAHSYSHLFGIRATGLRFFTVYGEWYRPDMGIFRFADAILSERPITIYNHGEMARDFTYVGDAVEAVIRLLALEPPASDGSAPHRIVNIASGRQVLLPRLIALLEQVLGKTAIKQYADLQAGDVTETWADTTLLSELTGFVPQTTVNEGLDRFAPWFKSWHHRTC